MTAEERKELERQRAAAKVHCNEVYSIILQMKGMLDTYYKYYYRWKDKYEKADRQLAEQDKLHKVKAQASGSRKKQPELELKLTKEQVIRIADELGIKLELSFDDEGGE